MNTEFLWRVFRKYPVPLLVALACITSQARVINANPSNYQTLLSELRPGDTLSLAPGFYSLLYLQNLQGTSAAWITISGAESPEGTGAANLGLHGGRCPLIPSPPPWLPGPAEHMRQARINRNTRLSRMCYGPGRPTGLGGRWTGLDAPRIRLRVSRSAGHTPRRC